MLDYFKNRVEPNHRKLYNFIFGFHFLLCMIILFENGLSARTGYSIPDWAIHMMAGYLSSLPMQVFLLYGYRSMQQKKDRAYNLKKLSNNIF